MNWRQLTSITSLWLFAILAGCDPAEPKPERYWGVGSHLYEPYVSTRDVANAIRDLGLAKTYDVHPNQIIDWKTMRFAEMMRVVDAVLPR